MSNGIKYDTQLILKKLIEVIEASGLSYGEIAKRTGIPKSSIHRYATGLTKKIPIDAVRLIADATGVSTSYIMGWEGKENTTPKSFGDSLTILDGKIRKIPLFESVAAGFGCLANNQIIDYVPLMIDSDAEADETICIKVSGNSMYPKIEDGDIIAVHKQSSIDSGKIGVFLIDNEDSVVKKVNYVYDEDWLELLSFNPEYMPRRFEGPDVERVKTLGLVKQIIKMI